VTRTGGSAAGHIRLKVFGTTPPCANCRRTKHEARKAAERFPDQVKLVELDALGPEAEQYGLITTPLVVVGDEMVGRGRVVPAERLVSVLKNKLVA